MTTIVRRGSKLSNAVLAIHAAVLLIASPVLAASGADNSTSYTLDENASTSQLLAEKPGKGNAGGNGKGGGNSGGNGNSDKGDGGNTGDAGSQDSESLVSGSGSGSAQETIISQEADAVDSEIDESYLDGTFPESYFLDKPLKKLQLQRYLIVDENDYLVSSVRPGESVGIVSVFKNMQQKEQVYTLITQVVDQDGITRDVSWLVDVVEGGAYVDWFELWQPDRPGVCTITVMVWDGVGGNPIPLSEVNVMVVMVPS